MDSSDDIRGGMGFEGALELGKFVQEGGTLITEGAIATMMAEYDLGAGVTVERPADLFARGSILRGVFADLKSPIAYGYDGTDLPVYFSQDPVFNVRRRRRRSEVAAGAADPGRANADGEVIGQNITPNSTPIHISPLDASDAPRRPDSQRRRRRSRRTGRRRWTRRTWCAALRPAIPMRPRRRPPVVAAAVVVVGEAAAAGQSRCRPRDSAFPGGRQRHAAFRHPGRRRGARESRAGIDAPLGKGHIVMFAIRPFWRWQSQGSYSLAFNAIVNWDHLDAGK